MKPPKEYLDLIDVKYLEARKLRLSRFSLEWGEWSVIMNMVLRRKTKGIKDIETMKLHYVFIYWTLVSELLELYYKHRLLRNKQKKRIAEEANDIKEMILTGNGLQSLLSEDEVVIQLLKGIGK